MHKQNSLILKFAKWILVSSKHYTGSSSTKRKTVILKTNPISSYYLSTKVLTSKTYPHMLLLQAPQAKIYNDTCLRASNFILRIARQYQPEGNLYSSQLHSLEARIYLCQTTLLDAILTMYEDVGSSIFNAIVLKQFKGDTILYCPRSHQGAILRILQPYNYRSCR